MGLFEELKEKIQGKKQRVVFPEATDERVLAAAIRLQEEDLLEPILLGSQAEIEQAASDFELELSDSITIMNPKEYADFDDMVEAFVERRRGKATEEQAREMLLDGNYFGCMLVYQDLADGFVSGAVGSTADTVRPALQIIKTRPGTKLISGSFVMVRGDERYVFADCAINLNPDAETLADIAIESARTAESFGVDPQIAMLSYSTKGSGAGEAVDKVREATEIAQEKAPKLKLDGELQFDAAFVPEVAAKKAPDSDVAGQANVFVFPDLQAGNIGYKMAQRLGKFEAIGPILQGMAKPVSDLSRGCVEEDVYKLGIITASQALDSQNE